MPSIQQHGSPSGTACTAGGNLVHKEEAQSRTALFLNARRQANRSLGWELDSPLPALLWMRHGFRRFKLDLNGKIEQSDRLAGPSMVFVPAEVSLKADFFVDGEASYTAVFFTPSSLMAEISPMMAVDPMVNFRHRELEQSLANMSREVARPDNLFDMLAEGWTLQAMAHLSRKSQGSNGERLRSVGGLSRTNRTRLEEYIRVNLSEAITLDDLARVIGLTTRHLNRAFRASFSGTPMQYIVALRMEKAMRMLNETRAPITEVALDCGFSHPQHFAASFSKAVGCSPSEFRRRSS